MKKVISFLLVFSFFFFLNSFAQVADYTFSTSAEPYVDANYDTIVAQATMPTSNSQDPRNLSNQVYTHNTIPFTFTFNGVNYTNVIISSNGYITFGQVPPNNSNDKCIEDSGKYRGAVAGLSSSLYGVFATTGDIINGSGIINNVTSFSGVVLGKTIASIYPDFPEGTTITSFNETARTISVSAPSNHTGHTTIEIASGIITRFTAGPVGARVHIIQFKNFRTFPTGPDEIYNFQIRLYESSQRIEVRYGICIKNSVSAVDHHQVGLRGKTNEDFNNRSINVDWSNTFRGSFNSTWCYASYTVLPMNGLVYIWDRPVPAMTDAGVTNANVITSSESQILVLGKSYDLKAEVQNEGINTLFQIPVYYKDNEGPAIGPVNTTGPIDHNHNENVSFNGVFEFTPTSSGMHHLKFFTSLAGDMNHFNDTMDIYVNVQKKINEFPYVQTFETPVNWTQVEEHLSGEFPLWRTALSINPNNEIGTSATCNFFACEQGRREILRSPVMDISSLTNPILNFHIAYQNVLTREDTIEVLVSTDAGVTFFSASTIYNKTFYSVPSLTTVNPTTGNDPFYPMYYEAWRYESINLANVSGSNEIVIGFRGKSGNGGSAWIDNIIVTGNNGYCENNITAPGIYNCNSIMSIDMTDLPSPGQNASHQLKNHSVTKRIFNSSNDHSGTFFTQKGSVNILSAEPTDNPTGGVLSISEHRNDATVIGVGIDSNNDFSTAPDGSIFTPDVVYRDFWFATTYTGNDFTGYSEYDISIDISSLTFDNPNKLYVVKRADRTAKWKAVSTTYSDGKLSVHDMNTFLDYAVAGDSMTNSLPVELTSFVSEVSGRNVTLKWSTASEINNSGFDIERSDVKKSNEWSKIGFVQGSGTVTTPVNYLFNDNELASGKYSYRLKQIDFNGNFTYYNLSSEVKVGIPSKFELSQNYPNPFNPSTKINYEIPVDGRISIKLFDLSGREVAMILNEVKAAGYYTVEFNASNLSSGIYFYRITAETGGANFTATKKMMLVK